MSDDHVVLAFDTSAAHCAAALLIGDRIVTRTDDMARGQAEHLMPMLERLLAEQGLVWADIDTIGVGTGPGNFTGIRMSVAAARGLALGLSRPAIGVGVLEAQGFGTQGPVLSTLRAPRDMVYAQRLTDGFPDAPPVFTDLTGALALAGRDDVAVLGDMAETLHLAHGLTVGTPVVSVIEGIALLAADPIYALDHPERPAPLYLRPADAAPARDAPPTITP
ncbi:tRNA threonylcarbamoyl adenosine modification protein YeaZ [Loktanella fryxellensis]|uniref:tRNA threonylcarbamoyl adenosine modification protein YeaZ n=1 Tax=Loktanella fryxellensis TaxID=245187 RepID=A0A1H8DDG2_9RHOB|nr:tRNA (adenosine(37)-N6)-threonylcarbamoyltransferase complex dimerization subunit type 1 TsaB [Loktanella fryxellensis]SEN05303.1 tRNA threonylcarbamoyl adenosine modification protein YeaZ [Loktanella fryxellensis]